MKFRPGHRTTTILATLALATILPAQQPPNVILSATGIPTGFSSQSTASCASMTIPALVNVLASEQLVVRLESTPTQVVPTPLVLRRVVLAVGLKDCSGSIMVGQSLIPIDFSSTSPPPAFPINSFADPSPLFGPPLLGPSVIFHPVPTDYLVPVSSFPLHLVMIAVAEDLPGGAGFIVSNALEVVIVDPAAEFAPSITGVTAPAGDCPFSGTPSPSGPETGGTPITITGSHFPVQTNWILHAPIVKIADEEATGIVVHSQSLLTAVTPAAATPTCPPVTGAGPRDVTFQNHPGISDGPATTSPIKFTYCTGREPIIQGIDLAAAHPEGGESLLISGFDFLHGADIGLTSVGFANLTTTLSPDDAAIQKAAGAMCASPTATTIQLTTPPFCTGPVSIQVLNPDGVASGTVMLQYAPLDPVVSSVTPTVTITGLASATTVTAITETGSMLVIGGSNFITPSSPLFGAPTVPQGATELFVSRTEIGPLGGGPLLVSSSAGVASSTAISFVPSIGDEAGEFRPGLGLKSLRVRNPPCVSISPTAPWPILIQDSAPPFVAGLNPNVVAQSAAGVASRIRITGANFFSTRTPTTLPVTKTFSGTPTLDQIDVPAVSFGGMFSPFVQLVSQNELIADLPAGLPLQPAVTVTVYNPDGRSTTPSAVVSIVPRLTDPALPLNPFASVLDAATLVQLAYPATNPYLASMGIVFLPNPTPNDDRLEDMANGGDPAITSDPGAYDGVFLFNTRDPFFNTLRPFDFAVIDVPATITLPSPVVIGNVVAVPAGVKRVIFKSLSFSFTPAFAPMLYVDQNFPLVLRSRGDFQFGGMLDLSGDALVNQGVAASPTLKFQYRCEWQLPPAGGGLGGRGGLHYELPLPNLGTPALPLLVLPALASFLSQPSLGTTAAVLGADSGYQPRERIALNPEPATWGRFGLGRAPFGGQGGGGGGGGASLPGGNGQIGATTSTGLGGAQFGNFTNVPAGTPGRPTGDAFVYGATAGDFHGPLGGTAAFPVGFFAGGSGGGGGGGSLALVVPCVSLGGRGGNGGGSAVLLADGTFRLGAFGRINADGEKGQLGIDGFPFANGEPLFVLCAPGSGGGGSGGLIYITAVTDVDLTAPIVTAGQRILSADGGLGGAPAGSSTVTTAHGGIGAPGRIRVAMNTLSAMVPLRQAQFQTLTSTPGQNVSPSPGPVINDVNAAFFRYPTP